MAACFSKLFAFFKKHLPLILILLFFVSIAPMLAVSMYNWPAGDDFRFSIQTHQAMSESGFPLFRVIQAAAAIAASSFMHWQGTYSAIFLMALQPGVFSSIAYIVVGILLIGALIFSTLYLLKTILSNCFHMERKQFIYIGIPMLFLQIQFVPSLVEAFYWYNGAMYYTFFYSLMLIYLTKLVQIYFGEEKKYKKNLIFLIVFSVILGGGNFVTAILTSLIGLSFIIFSLPKRSEQPKRIIWLALPEITLLLSFAASMLAPGNSVRQQFTTRLSPFKAIYSSITQAACDIINWTTPTILIICLLLIPVMAKLVKKTDLQFRWPGIWIGFTFLLFAAQNAPVFYAQAFAGQGRLRNIVFYSYIWLIFMNLFYCVGWLLRTYATSFSKLKSSVEKHFDAKERISTQNLVVAVLLVFLIVVNLNSTTLKKVSSVICFSDLISGKAAAYNQQLSERQKIIDNPNIDVVKIPALTVYPKSISASDITYNENEWTNKSMAIFYNKKSIVKYNKPVTKTAQKKELPPEPIMLE
jgi:hypothetical protein